MTQKDVGKLSESPFIEEPRTCLFLHSLYSSNKLDDLVRSPPTDQSNKLKRRSEVLEIAKLRA